MKRKTSEVAVDNDDDAEVAVSKKQIIEEEVVEHNIPLDAVNESPAPLVIKSKSSKTPNKSKTPAKLPSTTPRKKKAERVIYSASIDASPRDITETPTVIISPPILIPPALESVKHTSPAGMSKSIPSSEEKIKLSSPKVKKAVIATPTDESGFDLLSSLDLGLFGASWFVFGVLIVWIVLSVVQPVLAVTLQNRVAELFELVRTYPAFENVFVVELTYFFSTLLGFHFVLTGILGWVGEQ